MEEYVTLSFGLLLPAFLIHQARRLDADASGKGQILQRVNSRVSNDHKAGDNAKGELANHEPGPIEARVECGVDDVLRGVEQAGPEQWGEDSANQQRPLWENRQ